ncbi:hypothetical protein PUN28_012224 [Cardiocondyla obscurior]|uniref:Uncharacterized protein n=1 Tax=Cardiocondyla obscurior TaxID=286306 RepID=A0AAW2FDH3_9HYME
MRTETVIIELRVWFLRLRVVWKRGVAPIPNAAIRDSLDIVVSRYPAPLRQPPMFLEGKIIPALRDQRRSALLRLSCGHNRKYSEIREKEDGCNGRSGAFWRGNNFAESQCNLKQ